MNTLPKDVQEYLDELLFARGMEEELAAPQWLRDCSTVTLYRGVTQPYSKSTARMRLKNGFDSEYWSTSPDVARLYAGPDGWIASLTVESRQIQDDVFDEECDRNMIFFSRSHCGCTIPGLEICVYPGHENYDDLKIDCVSADDFVQRHKSNE